MKRKTAAEFLTELEADAEWAARRDNQEHEIAERASEHAADERDLVAEIRHVGYDVESIYDLVNNAPHPVLKRRFVGPYPAAYPILVRHLSLPHAPSIREGIIRALTVKDAGLEVETALLESFRSETTPSTRWVLANALRTAMPYHRRRKYPTIAAAFRTRQ